MRKELNGDRNAVNIGSSGDRTYHMLWHFQNGGLDIGHMFLNEDGTLKREMMPDALHQNVEGHRGMRLGRNVYRRSRFHLLSRRCPL